MGSCQTTDKEYVDYSLEVDKQQTQDLVQGIVFDQRVYKYTVYSLKDWHLAPPCEQMKGQ